MPGKQNKQNKQKKTVQPDWRLQEDVFDTKSSAVVQM